MAYGRCSANRRMPVFPRRSHGRSAILPTIPKNRAHCFRQQMGDVKAVQRPDELVDVVDEHNIIVRRGVTRAEMRRENLTHRCSFVLVFNSQGELFVQRRVSFKETYPSHYDPAPGGVVGSGETYEENALRELEEEMGIRDVSLEELFDFYYEDNLTKECEVESGEFLELGQVQNLLNREMVCPDSAVAFRKYLANQSKEAMNS